MNIYILNELKIMEFGDAAAVRNMYFYTCVCIYIHAMFTFIYLYIYVYIYLHVYIYIILTINIINIIIIHQKIMREHDCLLTAAEAIRTGQFSLRFFFFFVLLLFHVVVTIRCFSDYSN
jgi:hypothetical protein